MRTFLALVVVCSALVSISSHADTGTSNNTSPRSYTNHSDFKVGVGFDQGFGITAELYDQVDAFVGNEGLAADYLIAKNQKFTPSMPFTYYVGVGGFYDFEKTWHGDSGHWGSHGQYAIQDYCDEWDGRTSSCHHWRNDNHHYVYWERNQDQHFNDYGVRVPLGFDWQFAPQWDSFVQLAPKVNIPDDFHLGIDAALGVRYAFK